MPAMVMAILLIRRAFAAITAIAFKPNGPAMLNAVNRAAIIYLPDFFARKMRETSFFDKKKKIC